MNVLVTGGTGFVGQETVRALAAAGHAVHLLARDPASRKTQEVAHRHSARVRPGDVLEAGSLQSACTGMDAVIHLVGIISEAGDQTFENVHVRGTQNIIAAAQAAGIKRLVHMSALGTRPNAVARYHQTKWAAEEAVRESGLNWTIFRPSIIYGPGDGFVNLFARIIRLAPIVPVFGKGESRFQPIAVGNVAEAFAAALDERRAIGRTYDLVGPETLTLEEIVDAVLTVMRRKRFKLHVPFGIAQLQAAFLEWLFQKLLRRPPPLNRDQVLMLREDQTGDGREAEELFRLRMEPFAAGIARYLA